MSFITEAFPDFFARGVGMVDGELDGDRVGEADGALDGDADGNKLFFMEPVGDLLPGDSFGRSSAITVPFGSVVFGLRAPLLVGELDGEADGELDGEADG